MSIKLNGSSAGSVSFDAPSDTSPSGTDVTLTLPTSAGSAGQYLRNSGTAGTLEFGTIQGPAFAARSTSNQFVTSSTWTKAVFSSETFDTDNCYDHVTNHRFTPTKAGYYQVNGSIYLDYTTSASTLISTAIYKNGTLYRRGGVVAAGSGVGIYGSATVNDVIYLNGSTDYVELWGYSNGGGPYFQQTDGLTYFSATWVYGS